MEGTGTIEATIITVTKARNTLLAVLALRGFDVTEYENATTHHVERMYASDQLGMLVVGDKKKVYVHFCLKKKPDFLNIKATFFEELSQADDLILVCNKQSDSADEHVAHLWQEGYFVTLFDLAHLQYNILMHEDVPPHSVLTSEEKEAVLAKYGPEQDFPRMDRKDPVARLLGIRPGDMVKIDRPSPTALIEEYYRVCC